MFMGYPLLCWFPLKEKRIISPGKAEQDSLFLYLSPKLVCVWRMVGRMLGLTDSDIAAIDTAQQSAKQGDQTLPSNAPQMG